MRRKKGRKGKCEDEREKREGKSDKWRGKHGKGK